MVVKPLAKMIGCWAVSLFLTSVIFSGPVSGTKFLHEETDFHDEVCFWKTLTAHPIFNAIKVKHCEHNLAKFQLFLNKLASLKPLE